MKTWSNTASVFLILLIAAGCGGGGGGDGDGRRATRTTVAVSTRSVTASAAYGDASPLRTLVVSAINPPEDGLYVGISHSNPSVANSDLVPLSPTEAQIRVQFASPLQFDEGTVTDTITIEVCLDEQCAQPAAGSPLLVTASYTVTNPLAATIDVDSLTVSGSTLNPIAPTGAARIQIVGVSQTQPQLQPTFDHNSLEGVTSTHNGAGMQVDFRFRSPASMTAGVYTQNVALRVCYDPGCLRQVRGSPFNVAARYTVSNDAIAEPGLTPAPYLTRTALAHDVIDAEYSAAHDAIVMVASRPGNALYVYDVATGAERMSPLNRAPTSVSISPDGLTAAVGHDALITHLVLADVGVSGRPGPRILDASAHIADLVLDGSGYVHALPLTDQWVSVHSVEIATNTETLGSGFLYANARGKLHPSGDYMYTANNGLSPSDIAKYDIRTGVAAELYDSPYHGDYAMCGDLWMKEDGARIYTKCGNTFDASTLRTADMRYAGRLALSTSDYSYVIRSLSQSDETREILLIENDSYRCAPFNNQASCYTRLAVHESEFLNRTAVYSIPPIAVGDASYAQHGVFVFHSSDGSRKFMLSRLYGVSAASSFYLTELE